MWMCPTQAQCVEVFWMPVGLSGEALANFIQWGPFLGQKRKIGSREKFLMGSRKNQYFTLKYGPQHAFWCNMSKIWDDCFREYSLFCIPYFGPKWRFLGPEGPNLAQNIKNIVWQVVLTQNMTSQSQNWSHVETDNFGFSRPPKTPRGPSRAPRGTKESKNGPNHQ